jgi:hypothetical protein
MKRRSVTEGGQAGVARLWDMRLSVSDAPPLPPQGMPADTEHVHPLVRAEEQAGIMFGQFEVANGQARQSRALLVAMAAAALRQVE